MANTERISVSVDKDRAAGIRLLVEQGHFPSVSAAFDAAADALIEREAARADWWAETLRRCDEAEQNPERLLDADSFFRDVRSEISLKKASKSSNK